MTKSFLGAPGREGKPRPGRSAKADPAPAKGARDSDSGAASDRPNPKPGISPWVWVPIVLAFIAACFLGYLWLKDRTGKQFVDLSKSRVASLWAPGAREVNIKELVPLLQKTYESKLHDDYWKKCTCTNELKKCGGGVPKKWVSEKVVPAWVCDIERCHPDHKSFLYTRVPTLWEKVTAVLRADSSVYYKFYRCSEEGCSSKGYCVCPTCYDLLRIWHSPPPGGWDLTNVPTTSPLVNAWKKWKYYYEYEDVRNGESFPIDRSIHDKEAAKYDLKLTPSLASTED